jgi:hypothetical protein
MVTHTCIKLTIMVTLEKVLTKSGVIDEWSLFNEIIDNYGLESGRRV